MLRTLWFFFKLGIVVYALSWVLQYPGQITVDLPHYQLQTTFATGAIAIALAIFMIVFILRTGDWFRHLPLRFARWREQRGLRALTRGFVAIASGDSHDAMREAKRANRLLPKTPLKNLLLAQAEQLRGNRQGAAKYFVALMQDEETSFLGMRGLLNHAIADGKYDHALSLARQAYAKQPKSVAIWRHLFTLEARAHNWDTALMLLRKIERARGWPRDQIAQYYAVIYVEQAQLADKDGNMPAAHRLYKKAYGYKPDLIKAAVGYVESQLKLGRHFLAERALIRVWQKTPHPELAQLALIHFNQQPAKLGKLLRRLSHAQPNDASIHRIMVEYAISQQLWGMAVTHAEDMMKLSPTHGHHRLLQRLQNSIPANDNRLRLELQKIAAPFADPSKLQSDPVWVCQDCRATQSQWSANCRQCGEFAAMDWGQAAAFVPLRLPERI